MTALTIILYFCIAFCGPFVFLRLNKKNRWITKDSLRYDEGPIAVVILLSILWPMGLLVLLIMTLKEFMIRNLPQ